MSKQTDPRIAKKEMIVTRNKAKQKRQQHQLRDKDGSFMKLPNKTNKNLTNINYLMKSPNKTNKTFTNATHLMKSPNKAFINSRKRIKTNEKQPNGKNTGINNLEQDGVTKEYYPDKLRRRFEEKRIFLKPKYESHTVVKLNKRKMGTPQRGMTLEDMQSPSQFEEDWSFTSNKTDDFAKLSMEEVVRIVEETESLDDEDLMEILTCPSPVWWEDPPDDNYVEDAIYTRTPENVQKTSNNSKKSRKDKSPKNSVKKHTKNNEKPAMTDFINVIKAGDTFMKKRSKLENVLGNIKNKANTGSDIVAEKNIDVADKNVGVADENVDVADENVDVADESVDVADENVGVGDENVDVADENVDVADENVDVADENINIADENVDDADENVDVADKNVDVADENIFDAEENVDVAEENVDIADENVDVADENVDVADENIGIADENVDVTGDNVDVADKNVDIADENIFDAEENVDVAEENVDVADENVDVADENIDDADESVDVADKNTDVANKNIDEEIHTISEESNVSTDVTDEQRKEKRSSESTESLSDFCFSNEEMLRDLENMDIPIDVNCENEDTLDKKSTEENNPQIIKIQDKSEPDSEPNKLNITLAPNIPLNLPRLTKRPKLKLHESPSVKSLSDETELSSVSEQENIDTISDTNIKFIIDDDIEMTLDNDSVDPIKQSKNEIDTDDRNKVKKTNIDVLKALSDKKEFITVYRIVSNDKDNDKDKSSVNKFKNLPEYSNFVENLSKEETRDDFKCNRQLNSFFKKCKFVIKRKKKDNDSKEVDENEKESFCDTCEPKKCITVAQDENVKYCLNCSSIFDTDDCSYCLKSKSGVTDEIEIQT